MLTKKEQRIRRAKKTRARISSQKSPKISIFRSNLHIYATIISADGSRILASASTVEKPVKDILDSSLGGNISAAVIIGRRIAQKAKEVGVTSVAFDRAGFAYHGRIKALAEAAREAGLNF